MRTFVYDAYDRAGRRCSGLVEGEDVRAARLSLAKEGLFAVSLREAGNGNSRVRALGEEARGILYRELAALLRAGNPLVPALNILMGMREFAGGREALAAAKDRLREGSGLGESLAEGGLGPDEFERAALDAGARAGRLEESLERLADWLLSRHALQSRVRNALTYPGFVLLFAVIAAAIMLGVVLPSTLAAIERSGIPVEWPRITRWMMGMRVVARWFLPIFLFLGLAGGVWWNRFGRCRRGLVEALDRLKFGVPVVGRGLSLLVNIRFAGTFAMALRGGVPAEDALLLAGRASGSPWVSSLAEREWEEVRHGRPLAQAIERIPPLAVPLASWVETGESSGMLAEMMDHAARRLQGQWERWTLRLLGLLEPALLVLVGLFVFGIALAIILPLVQMNQAVLKG